MIGSLVLLALVVAAFGAWGMWGRRRDSSGATGPAVAAGPAGPGAADSTPPPSAGGGPAGDLERWVGAGLISRRQADAIAAYEGRAAAPRSPTGERRVSLIAEALGYVGAVLALAGAAVGLGQAWEGIPTWGQLAIAAAATVLLLIGGLVLRHQVEPAFERLASVLWFLTVGAGAGTLAVLAVEGLEWEDGGRITLLIGAGTAALAGLLWAIRRAPLQHLALFITLHAALVGAILCLPGDAPGWSYALLVLVLGILWALLGWRRVLEPWWLALGLGSVGAMIGPSIAIGEYPWLLVAALATSVFLMVVSVPSGQFPLLAVGTLGTFAYLTWAVVRYFSDSLGVPLALVIVGGVFLALAVIAGRLTQVTRVRRWRSRGRGDAANR